MHSCTWFSERQVPVRAFVSTVSRTTRINTKLEKSLFAFLSCPKRSQLRPYTIQGGEFKPVETWPPQ